MFQALLLTQSPEGATLAGVDSIYAPQARRLLAICPPERLAAS